jgi:hypothetical protein
MSQLLIEIALRLAKVVVASLLGLLIYLVLTGPFGVEGTPELALLAWIAGSVSLLLMESSPL